MRDEEDEMVFLQPHSQSRHEHLHNQYNKLKEEDQWQDVSHTNSHKHVFNELTRISVYILWLLCVGLGTLEESEAKCISWFDQKGRREEDDGEANDSRWRIWTSQKEHQDIQRNRRGEVRQTEISIPSWCSRMWGLVNLKIDCFLVELPFRIDLGLGSLGLTKIHRLD